MMAGSKPLIFMRFHGVSFGSQHEIWSKQHNGKVRREKRCLLILDNVESVLQEGLGAGQYRKGYEAYGKLFQLIGETKH